MACRILDQALEGVQTLILALALLLAVDPANPLDDLNARLRPQSLLWSRHL